MFILLLSYNLHARISKLTVVTYITVVFLWNCFIYVCVPSALKLYYWTFIRF